MAEINYPKSVTGVLFMVFGFQHVKQSQKLIKLSGGRKVIGKSSTCDFRLPNALIQGNAAFTYSNGGWSVRTNETVCLMKNGKQYRKGKALLETGDIIAFGKNVPMWYCFKYTKPWLKCARKASSTQRFESKPAASGAVASSQTSLNTTSDNEKPSDDKGSKPPSASIMARLAQSLETGMKQNLQTYSYELFCEMWKLNPSGIGWVDLDVAKQHCLNQLTRDTVKQFKDLVTVKEQDIAKRLENIQEILEKIHFCSPSSLQFALWDCYTTIMRCPICLCTSIDPVKIKCGHMFCKSCVRSNSLCPRCGIPIWTPKGLNSLGFLKFL